LTWAEQKGINVFALGTFFENARAPLGLCEDQWKVLRMSKMLWLPVLLMMAQSTNGALVQPVSSAPVRGIDVTQERFFRDMRKLINCRYASPTSCEPAWSAGFTDVGIEEKDQRIHTVTATIFLNGDLEGFRANKKSLGVSAARAATLVHYLMPDWRNGETWTRKAVSRSAKQACSIVTRHNGITVLIYPGHFADAPAHFLKLAVTRSRSLDAFPYDMSSDCFIGTDNP
jgi:hypothetical protein